MLKKLWSKAKNAGKAAQDSVPLKNLEEGFKKTVTKGRETVQKAADNGKQFGGNLGENLTKKLADGAKTTGDTAKKAARVAAKPVNNAAGRIKDDFKAQQKHSTGSGLLDMLAPFAPLRDDRPKPPAKPVQKPKK